MSDHYKHLARIRMGIDGPTGVLLRCERRDGSGTFWRVKLDGIPVRWTYPDDRMLLDGPGDQVGRCVCGWNVITTDANMRTVVCAYCAGDVRGKGVGAVRDPRAYVKAPR